MRDNERAQLGGGLVEQHAWQRCAQRLAPSGAGGGDGPGEAVASGLTVRGCGAHGLRGSGPRPPGPVAVCSTVGAWPERGGHPWGCFGSAGLPVLSSLESSSGAAVRTCAVSARSSTAISSRPRLLAAVSRSCQGKEAPRCQGGGRGATRGVGRGGSVRALGWGVRGSAGRGAGGREFEVRGRRGVRGACGGTPSEAASSNTSSSLSGRGRASGWCSTASYAAARRRWLGSQPAGSEAAASSSRSARLSCSIAGVPARRRRR